MGQLAAGSYEVAVDTDLAMRARELLHLGPAPSRDNALIAANPPLPQ